MVSHFSPECSKPGNGTNFVASPDVRGTLQIFWTALTTLVLCTWSIQHFNIPPQVSRSGWLNRLRHSAREFCYKLFWMFLTLIAPELLMGTALVDLVSAHQSRRKMERLTKKDNAGEWTTTHSYYANLGGFVLYFGEEHIRLMEESGLNTAEAEASHEYPMAQDMDQLNAHHTRDHAQDLEMGGTQYPRGYASVISLPQTIDDQMNTDVNTTSTAVGGISWEEICTKTRTFSYQSKDKTFDLNPRLLKLSDKNTNIARNGGVVTFTNHKMSSLIAEALYECQMRKQAAFHRLTLTLGRLQGSCWVLDAFQLCRAREMGLIKNVEELTNVSKEKILDQSKTDIIAKTIALWQASYLIFQLIMRRAEGLRSAPCEIAVAAFAAWALITYLLLIRKPQGVRTPLYIDATRYPTPKEILEIATLSPTRIYGNYGFSIWEPERTYTIPNLALYHCTTSKSELFAATSFLTAFVFAGVQYVSSPISLPGPPKNVEHTLWKVASYMSVFITVLAITAIMALRLLKLILGREKYSAKLDLGKKLSTVRIRTLQLLFALYSIARLIMIGEIIRSIFYMPASVFETTWAGSYILHVGA